MGLLDDLTPPGTRSYPCRVRTIIESLDEADAKIFTDAVADMRWSGNALAKAMSDRGIELGVSAIQKHRAKGCSCSKI